MNLEKFNSWKEILNNKSNAVIFETITFGELNIACYVYRDVRPNVSTIIIEDIDVTVSSYEEVITLFEQLECYECESCSFDNINCSCCKRIVKIKILE